jgi:hypothetical protein
VIDLVKNNLHELETLCKKHKVKSLSLFGSATTNTFNKNSDLDFVVEFNHNIPAIDYADYYFALLEDLKNLFKKEIDLLSFRALKNKVMIAEIEKSKVQLYAA